MYKWRRLHITYYDRVINEVLVELKERVIINGGDIGESFTGEVSIRMGLTEWLSSGLAPGCNELVERNYNMTMDTRLTVDNQRSSCPWKPQGAQQGGGAG